MIWPLLQVSPTCAKLPEKSDQGSSGRDLMPILKLNSGVTKLSFCKYIIQTLPEAQWTQVIEV